MMKNGFIFLLMLLLMAANCERDRKGNTIIYGTLDGAGGKKLLLQELGMQESEALDSVVTDKGGNFFFDIPLKAHGLYLLAFPRLPPLILELKPGDSVGISAPAGSFPLGARLQGSLTSSELLEFFNTTNRNRKIYDSLESVLVSHQDEPGFAVFSTKMDESLKPLWENQRELEITYINRHLNSLTSLLVLNQGIGSSPVLTFLTDSVYFLLLDSSLGRAFPGNMHVDFHHKRIIQERELERLKTLKR